MPILAGLDEAGYGPNLGPLVQVMVCLETADLQADFWQCWAEVVRKVGSDSSKQTRWLVDDSKKVYGPKHDLALLEESLWGLLSLPFGRPISDALVQAKITGADWQSNDGLDYGYTVTPCRWIGEASRELVERYLSLQQSTGRIVHVGVCLTWPGRFNHLVDQFGSKAAPVLEGVKTLLHSFPWAGQPAQLVMDRLGGRTHYAPFLQDCFPDSWLTVEREHADACVYRVATGSDYLKVRIQPRADGDSFAVSLASMLAKYLREIAMKEWNEFWKKHLPDVAPTAGYPLDAKRFYGEIEPWIGKLGLFKKAIWRDR